MKVLHSNKFMLFIVMIPVFLLFRGSTPGAFAAPAWEKIVDHGYAGYSETGIAWRTYSNEQSHDGSYRYLSAWERDLPRSGTATWTTTIPYDGLYRVAVSYRQTENRSPDANFFATNESGGMDEIVINQRGPLAYIWRTLGEYYYSAGQTVKVHLDGTDDDFSDCADAAAWTLIQTGLPAPDISPIITSLLSPPHVGLSVVKAGPGSGTVRSFPGGIFCGPMCSSDIDLDTDIVVKARASRGSFFMGWSGCGCSGAGDCSVCMTEDQVLTAAFGTLAQYDLSVSISGTGSVSTFPESADGNPINCFAGTCTRPYYADDLVFFTAVEDRSSVFTAWSGDCLPTAGNPLVAAVNMGSAPKTCNAAFDTKPRYDLTVTVTGTGDGTVTSSPLSADGNPIHCSAGSCTEPYWEDDVVTLDPDAAFGSAFTGWTGDADCADGVVTIDADMECIAQFDLSQGQHTLTIANISLDSGNYGDVAVSPGSMNCEGSPGETEECAEDIDQDLTVTLTAEVASGEFLLWWDDCTATADPLVATVTMDGDKKCTAVFGKLPF